MLLSCSLGWTGAIAQTGVTVVGDVYIAPCGQMAVHADTLTLDADIQGEGELIMAATTPQCINGKGHTISRLTIANPTHVDLVSDLDVNVALTIPQGELHLLDCRLIVPSDGVIDPRAYSHIRRLGRGILLIKSRTDNPVAKNGTPAGSSGRIAVALLAVPIDWQGFGFVSTRAIPAGLLASVPGTGRQVPAPPPKAGPFWPRSFITHLILTARLDNSQA